MDILTADEIAIRMATERAVSICGARQAATALGTDVSKISRLQNISNDESSRKARVYLKAHEALTLDRLAGAPIISAEMVEMQGHSVAEKVTSGVAAEGMPRHSAAILKEVAEAIKDMADALTRTPSRSLAERIHESLQDVIDRSKDAQAECLRVIAEPTLRRVS